MDSRNWNAHQQDRPGEVCLRVTGEVYAANPGVQARLQRDTLQFSGEDGLRLELQLSQRPGFWPQVMTWMQVRQELALAADRPDPGQVEIWHRDALLARVIVDR